MSHRRVVLATNVAETSLTVPGIRYVIDPGTARISRYSLRTKVQRLPIEPISQASANQRKGRCGRVADGICIRLYSEEDFDSRPEFTDPEIQRTNLASVILQMAAARLGDVRAFPFVDPPDPRASPTASPPRRARRHEERPAHRHRPADGPPPRRPPHRPHDHRVGPPGLRPRDPGHRRRAVHPGPARAPRDNQQAADTAHRRFTQPESDFLAFLALWDYLAERQRELSGSAFRRLCRAEFLNYLRVREWQDLHAQLRLVRDSASIPNLVSERARVHTALLAGLFSHVGMKVVLPPGPGAPALSAAAARCPSTSGPAAPGSRSSPAPPWHASHRTGSSPPSSSRPRGCGPAPSPASSRNGSSRSPRTWSSGPTASPAGRGSSGASSPREVTLYGIPIVATGR